MYDAQPGHLPHGSDIRTSATQSPSFESGVWTVGKKWIFATLKQCAIIHHRPVRVTRLVYNDHLRADRVGGTVGLRIH